MSTALQLRRGTTAQHASFTGANGEISVDTDKDVVVVHDGSTAGGFPLLRAGAPVTDAYGNVRAVPQSGSAKTSSYSLVATDAGRFIQVGSSGSITIPNSTFAAGDVVSLFNNTSGNITVTCSTTNAYIAGTDTNKTSVTLATRGLATILFITSTLCIISGNVT